MQVAELVHQFQCQPGDTGSTPVQSQWFPCNYVESDYGNRLVAVLTFRIKHLTEHVQKNRKVTTCIAMVMLITAFPWLNVLCMCT